MLSFPVLLSLIWGGLFLLGPGAEALPQVVYRLLWVGQGLFGLWAVVAVLSVVEAARELGRERQRHERQSAWEAELAQGSALVVVEGGELVYREGSVETEVAINVDGLAELSSANVPEIELDESWWSARQDAWDDQGSGLRGHPAHAGIGPVLAGMIARGELVAWRVTHRAWSVRGDQRQCRATERLRLERGPSTPALLDEAKIRDAPYDFRLFFQQPVVATEPDDTFAERWAAWVADEPQLGFLLLVGGAPVDRDRFPSA